MDQVHEIIERACDERRILRIHYPTPRSPGFLIRDVEVYLYDNTYVEGYCRLRQSQRVFRIDRILNLELTGEVFQPDPWWIEYYRRFGYIREPLRRVEVVKPVVVDEPRAELPPVPGPDQGEFLSPAPSESGGPLRMLLRILTWGTIG